MANLVVSALSTWDNRGLKKAKKEISAFEKSVKSLGKAFGVAFAASTIVNYSKKAVDAFAKDQAAAKALETQLKNTGYAFSAPDIEYYIANLQALTGVLDDQLRPAFQTLLTASGSLVKSQKALAVALDVSAATGKSVEEVSAAIAKGFTGQTTALARLGAGLDAATLKSGDMNQILDELGNKFSGQSQARLTTYAGKLDLLKVSAANASETIGKGLLDALSQIGKDKNIATLGTSLEKVATTIANVVVGLGAILGKVISIGQAIFEKLHLDKVIGFLYNNSLISKLASFGASQTNKPSSNFTYSLGSGAGTEIAKLQELKARKALIVQLKAETELKKLKDKYDLERIGLMAALNAATDEETKLRLAEKLAILDGNAAMAAKYLAERNAEQGLEELAAAADDAKAAFDRLAKWDPLSGLKATPADIAGVSGLLALAGALGGGAKGKTMPNDVTVSNGVINPNFAYPSATTNYDPLSSLIASSADISSAGAFNPLSGLRAGMQDITINIDATNMVDSANMTKVVQDAFLQINKNGYSTVPAGQGF